MSYIVIPVYDFACDEPGCNKAGYEYTPANDGRPNEPLPTIAHRQLRAEGWTVRRNVSERRWEHWCPEHKPEAAQS